MDCYFSAERNSSFSSRTQKPSLSEFYPIPRNLQPARSTQQKSPDTLLSTTNASNFSYKPIQRSVSHESVIAPEPVNPDIAQFLKVSISFNSVFEKVIFGKYFPAEIS